MATLPRGAEAICDLLDCEIITKHEVCPITLSVVRVYALGLHPDPAIGESGYVLTDFFKSEAGLLAFCLTDVGLDAIADAVNRELPHWNFAANSTSQLA